MIAMEYSNVAFFMPVKMILLLLDDYGHSSGTCFHDASVITAKVKGSCTEAFLFLFSA
jgi:hypothetical protein